jgi:hypothetical protein
VNLGTSVLEGSNVEENWAMYFGGVVGGGCSNKAREAEDILGAIAGSGGSSSSIASACCGWQWQSPKPPHLPSPVSRASLVREAMARMLLSSSALFLVAVSKPIIISLNFLTF